MNKYLVLCYSAFLFSGVVCFSDIESSDSEFFISVGPFWSADFYSADYKGKDYGTKYGIGYMFQSTSTFQWGAAASWWETPDVTTITSGINTDFNIPLLFDTLVRGDYLSFTLEGRIRLNTYLSGIIQLGGVYSRVDTYSSAIYDDNSLSSIFVPNHQERLEVSDRRTEVDFVGAVGASWSFYPSTTSVSWIRKGEIFLLFGRSNGNLYQSSIDLGARVYF